MVGKALGGKTIGLFAKHQPIPCPKIGLEEGGLRLRAEKEHTGGVLHHFPPFLPGGVMNEIQVRPVIEPGAAKLFIGYGEAELSYQVELAL